jgi:hypothetical protein
VQNDVDPAGAQNGLDLEFEVGAGLVGLDHVGKPLFESVR